MKFNNKPNKLIVEHLTGDKYWHSRSVAVNLVVILTPTFPKIPHVLVAKRGPNAADYQGQYNLVAGYLDWDETGAQAVSRECYEETGLILQDLIEAPGVQVIRNDLNQPWHVKTDPKANRQNISLRYGLKFSTQREFPELNTDNNEVAGEVEDPQWLPVEEIPNYQWAFDHDRVITDYMSRVNI